MRARLNEVEAVFDQRNAFLFAALGAISLQRRVRRLVAPPHAVTPADGDEHGESAEQSEIFDALLGVLALGYGWRTRRRPAAADPAPRPTATGQTPPATRARTPGDLLA